MFANGWFAVNFQIVVLFEYNSDVTRDQNYTPVSSCHTRSDLMRIKLSIVMAGLLGLWRQ